MWMPTEDHRSSRRETPVGHNQGAILNRSYEESCKVLFVNTETTLRISRDMAAGSRQMVAAKHPWAVRAGNDILDQGGNAVDAAVATAFAISVVEPWMSGLGGVGFMTVQRANGERYVVDYFGQAPVAATPDMYELTEEFGHPSVGFSGVKDQANAYGPRSAAVPGMVRGMEV